MKIRTIFFNSDEKINFAAYQGMVAAKSKIVYFKHNNMEDLERLLLEYQEKEEKVIPCICSCLGFYVFVNTVEKTSFPQVFDSRRDLPSYRNYMSVTKAYGTSCKVQVEDLYRWNSVFWAAGKVWERCNRAFRYWCKYVPIGIYLKFWLVGWFRERMLTW